MHKDDDKTVIIHISSGSFIKSLLFLVLAAGVYYFWDLILVVLMAVVIASAIEPAAKGIMRRGVPRLLAVLFIYIGAALFISGVVFFFLPPLVNDAASFVRTLPAQLDSFDIFGPIVKGGPAVLQPGIEEISKNISLSDIVGKLQDVIGSASSNIFRVVSVIFGGLMSFVLIIVLSFYLSVQDDGVANFLRIVTPLRHEKYVIDLWRRAQFKIGRWMQGQVVLGLIVGVLVYLGLTLLGVRYALLLAVLAAAFELIPIFGPILAAIPAVVLGFIDGGLSFGFLVVGFYVIIQQFENQLIYPLVVRKVVGVPPLLVILALVVGARIAGFLGIVLSVPIAAAVREYFNDVEKRKDEAWKLHEETVGR